MGRTENGHVERSFWPYCLRYGVFITPFVVLLLKDLLCLIKSLAQLAMICPTISAWISSDCWSGGTGRKSCQTLIFILFDWAMFLIQYLLCVSGVVEISKLSMVVHPSYLVLIELYSILVITVNYSCLRS